MEDAPGYKKLNVILDIDETLAEWLAIKWKLNEDKERKFGDTITPYLLGEPENGWWFLRPHLDEFLNFLFDNCRTVNLWTYSERSYAERLARLLGEKNPKWKFTNVWAAADKKGEHDDGKIAVAENGCNKDLNYIWYPDLYDVKPHKGGPFYPCDTILVDDKNIQGNDCNFRNGIMVPEFFGSAMAGKLDQDTALLEVIKKLKEVMQNPAFCSVANDRGIKELPYPFPKATKRRPTIVSGGGRRKTMKRKSSHKKTRRHRK